MPTVVKAILVKPGARRGGPGRELRAPTYRLTLFRESPAGDEPVHSWGGIPHERVGPLLRTMQEYLPWLARAAAAREALGKLLDLFR